MTNPLPKRRHAAALQRRLRRHEFDDQAASGDPATYLAAEALVPEYAVKVAEACFEAIFHASSRTGTMRILPDYYKILKVQPDAPIEIIRASYRTLMRELKVHPDLGGSTETAALLNEAYEVLSDRDRRAEYDRRLSAQSGPQAAAPSTAGKPRERLPLCPFCKHVLPRRAMPGDCCPTCESPVRSQEMAGLEEASRRSVSRMKRDDLILFYTAWPQKGCEGRLVDLSPRGLRFVSGEMLDQWSVIKVSAASFEALAAVTNIGVAPDSGQGNCSVGASFIAVKFEGNRGTFLSARA